MQAYILVGVSINDGKGNGHILIMLLAIATQRQLCFNKRFL